MTTQMKKGAALAGATPTTPTLRVESQDTESSRERAAEDAERAAALLTAIADALSHAPSDELRAAHRAVLAAVAR